MYLNKRAIEILKYLLYLADEAVELSELAKHFKIGERSIRYDLEDIDFYLREKNLPPLKKVPKIEVSLAGKDLTKAKREEIRRDLEKDSALYLPLNRKNWLFIELVFHPQKISIRYLEETLDVSRSTILKDIKLLKKELAEKHILLEYSNTAGYFLLGDEYEIRRETINLLSNNRHFKQTIEAKVLNQEWKIFQPEQITFIEEIIKRVERKLQKTYSGEAFINLIFSLLLLVNRLKNQHILEPLAEDIGLENREYMILSQKAAKLQAYFKIDIPAQEVWFMTNLFLAGNLLKSEAYSNENWVGLYLQVKQFIDLMSEKLQVDLQADKDLFNALVLHLGPAISRLENKMFLENEIIQYIQETYPEIFEMVADSFAVLTAEQAIEFSDDEIGFVTLHIASALETISMKTQKLKVLIVCNYGIGTSKLLETRVDKFLDFDIQGTISKRDLNNQLIEDNKIDLIISTISLKRKYQVPIVNVTPLLNEQDIKKLKEFEPSLKEYRVTTRELYQQTFELVDLLTIDKIQTKVPAKNWRESIQLGGALLKNAGDIEDIYIVKMIEALETVGPYVVIAPSVALPHAEPGIGVVRAGFSLITLDHPVNFGHAEYDPVEIVICLAAKNHTSHLNALQTLVEFLSDKEGIQKLKEAKTPREVAEHLNIS